jgi:protein gp37
VSQATAIEWTDLTWNPVHGCSKVSPGCAHCYAETLSRRYKQTLSAWTPANAVANVLLKPHKLREPLSGSKEWRGLGAAAAAAGLKRGKLVFVNSTSDLFHEQIPDEYIGQVLNQIYFAGAHFGHVFQVLTKRPERMRDCIRRYYTHGGLDGTGNPSLSPATGYGAWSTDGTRVLPNLWLGVSIENRRYVGRADVLRDTPAAVRFISAEPLLGPLTARFVPETGDYGQVHGGEFVWPDGKTDADFEPLNLVDIDWLIVGGESGAAHRPVNAEWVLDLRDQAQRAGTAFFFKQWGGRTPNVGGRLLDGREWSEFPRAGREAAIA